MPLTIKFDLSDEDLEHFRTLMRQARERARDRTQEQVVQAAHAQRARLVEVEPVVDGIEMQDAHLDRVTRLGPAHYHRPHHRVRPATGVIASQLRQVLDSHAWLQRPKEVCQRVAVHDSVARVYGDYRWPPMVQQAQLDVAQLAVQVIWNTWPGRPGVF